LFFTKHLATTFVQYRVDSSDGVFRALNLHEVDRFLETRGSQQSSGITHTTTHRDDLTSSTMDGISMERDIENVESNSTHVLLSTNTFLGSPLEGSYARILDFIQVLHTLGDVNEEIGSGPVRTERPDLSGIGDIPAEVISKDTSSQFEIVTRADFAGFNGEGEFLVKRQSLDVKTIVLVLRFG